MNAKYKTISITILAGLILLLFGAAGVFAAADVSVEVEDRYGAAQATLDDGAIVQYIGDLNTSFGASGSGVFDPFVRLQGNNKKTQDQKGYNTDGTREWDTKAGTWTHSILLSEIPTILVDGNVYWEFWADINDSDSTPLISLDDFELYLTDDPDLSGYDFGANATEIYDYTAANNGYYILINDVNQGSGRGDLRYLVPVSDTGVDDCDYGNPACTTYLVLYSVWGGKGDPYGFDGGFEEWKVKIYPKLQVLKDIYGSYDTPVTWEITKDFDGTYSGYAGDSWTHGYEVSVVPSFGAPENTMVFGTITIIGDEDTAVDATITDKFNGAAATITGCSVAENPDGTYTIAAGATVTCGYELALGAPTDGTNVARASFVVDTVALAFEGSADILEGDFVGTFTGNPDIDVTDTNGEAWSASYDSSETWTYTRDLACPTDASKYENGFHSFIKINTATITQTGQSDTATVTVNCNLQPLVPTKTAAGEWERDVDWTLTKSVDPASHTGYAGQDAGSSTWTVVATKTDSGPYDFHVFGAISIYNPAAIAQSFTLTDVLNDAAGTTATFTCDMSTIPAGGTATCGYDAYPEDASATLNTATVSAAGNPDQDATASVGWTENLDGYDTGTLSDPRFDYSELIGDSTTKTFDETFVCSDKASDYTDGHYQYTEVNWAYLNDNIDLEASATVTVDCYLDPLVPTKTAAGEWERDVDWTLEKYVEPASHSGLFGESFVSIWEVIATKTDSGPYGFHVFGAISIYNPAAIDQDFTISDTMNDGSVATVVCPTYTVVAGGTVDCTFTASPADASATLNTVTVTAAGNLPQQASDPIEWSENLDGYDEGELSDPRFEYIQLISDSTTVTFEETFTCSTDINDYTNGFYSFTEVNTARLNGNIDLEASATVTVDCTLVIEYETAYAYGGDLATCFSEFGESRWGWVNGPILPGVYTWAVYAGAGGCDPSAGTHVGFVIVTYDETDFSLSVEWDLFELNVLSAEHIYAGYADHPDSFAPGQLENQGPFDGSPIYVIVHGVVGIPQIP